MVNRGFKLAKLYISEHLIPGARCLVFMEKMTIYISKVRINKGQSKIHCFWEDLYV